MTDDFESIFNIAIKEWPEILDISTIQFQSEGRYTVSGLGPLLDGIEAAYHGTNKEIVFCQLHSAIYIVIHTLAKNICKVKVSDLRLESVHSIFKQRLQATINANDPSWSTADFTLAQSYL